MKNNLKGIILPDCLLFNGIYLYEASGYSPYLTYEKLNDLKLKIEKTLDYYKEFGYTDLQIDDFNKKYYEDLFIQDTKKEKEKKNVGNDLYLMINSANMTLKIGRSNYPIQRLKQLNTASSDKIELLYVYPGFGSAEKRLHKKFEEYKLNGEWFMYSKEIIDFMKDFSIFKDF